MKYYVRNDDKKNMDDKRRRCVAFLDDKKDLFFSFVAY